MDKKLTFTGGEPAINFDDILRTPNATRDAFIEVFRSFGDNYIIQGVTGATSITEGYVMLDGEILKVDAHTRTSTHFVKVTTYEAGGDKTFNDATPRQTWQKNRATITAGSGSITYASAKRMPDAVVDTITAGTSVLASANLPIASTAEAQALTLDTVLITPSGLSDVTGGLLTAIVDIGDWDMDADSSVFVAHGLTYSKIRGVKVTIRNDAGTSLFDFGSASATAFSGGVQVIGSNVVLTRAALFDDPAYDSTSYNRGWVIIYYIP